jgi:ketosteroid isomerase-like protein
MSQENVAVVRRAWEAAANEPLDRSVAAALYHPQHVLESQWGGVNDTAYRGAQGYQDFLADLRETWDDWHQQLDEVIDAGGVFVVVAARLVAKGKQSATPVNQTYGVVFTLDEGKIVRTQAFLTVEDALEAVGLSNR